MSRRGGKRREVVQLSSTSSKLHRYGYSKQLHSGKGAVAKLIGDYASSESDGNDDEQQNETGQHVEGSRPATENASIPEENTTRVTKEDENPEADMDDQLRSFLFEIESIPMPTEDSPQPKLAAEEDNVKVTPILPGVSTDSDQSLMENVDSKKGTPYYSMFVKGESEFVDNSNPTVETQEKVEMTEKVTDGDVDEGIPDEPKTDWQMVQDESTQYYYYWNTTTNQVTWEIPVEYTQYLLLHREYLDKVAKYAPEQIKAFPDLQAKKGAENFGKSTCANSTPETSDSPGIDPPPLTAGPHEFSAMLEAKESSDPSVKGHGDATKSFPHHKSHVEERKSRSHKHKKHKRRRGYDSDSQPSASHIDSTGSDRCSPSMPDIGPPVLTTDVATQPAAQAITQKSSVLSIVPYLSDPEDDDNEDSNSMPELGPAIPDLARGLDQRNPDISVPTQDQDEVSGDPELGPAIRVPNQEQDKACEDPLPSTLPDVGLDLAKDALPDVDMASTEQTMPTDTDLYSNNGAVDLNHILLLPPPPPPPPEEDEETGKEKSCTHGEVEISHGQETENINGGEMLLSKEDNRYLKMENNDLNHETDGTSHQHMTSITDFEGDVDQVNSTAIVGGDSLKVSEDTNTSEVGSGGSVVHAESGAGIIDISNVKVKKKSSSKKKKVYDMFAESDDMNKFQPEVDSPRVSQNFNSLNNGVLDVHDDFASKGERAIDTEKEEPMEDGEILDKGEVENADVNPRGEKKRTKPSSEAIKSSRRFKERSDPVCNEGKSSRSKGISSSKSVSIVASYGTDEEEEEGELRETDRKPKRKSKDMKKDGKKRKGDEKMNWSSSKVKKRSSENISSAAAASMDAVAQVANLSSQSNQLSAKGVDDNRDHRTNVDASLDIDPEDIDDIDRALELALEKKLEEKKVELNTYGLEDKVSQVAGSGQKNDLTTHVHASALPTQDFPPEAMHKPEKEKTAVQEDEAHKKEVRENAELALSKLEFLDISTENLSRLQVLFIELQTRLTDWTAGGLSTAYLNQQLCVAQGLLEQYELSAVPEGWVCQWDRANSRYYYRNKTTNRIQWDYPEPQTSLLEKKSAPDVIQKSREQPQDVIKSREPPEDHRKQRSGSSRRRSKDEKERSKHDKRSSSHRHRRKRRRRRDHSSSSDGSDQEAQQPQPSQSSRHHKSKRKKRRKSMLRSPSVEIVDVGGKAMGLEPITIEDPMTPSPSDSCNPPALSVPDKEAPDSLSLPPAPVPSNPIPTQEYLQTPVETDEEQQPEDTGDVLDADEAIDGEEMESEEVMNNVVISKPPQIMIPPDLAASQMPDVYWATHVATATAAVSDPTPTQPEGDDEDEVDKVAKKKKKDKKSLATGSSIMMKKKHMSSMVQKWQRVKKEVEKEDQAKELRQAAIRQKINELK